MMQRLNDHVLGSTLIMARMEGAGDNDAWQVMGLDSNHSTSPRNYES
jgi:hypothetical protein